MMMVQPRKLFKTKMQEENPPKYFITKEEKVWKL